MSLSLTYRFIEKQLQRIGFWPPGPGFAPLRPDAPFWAVGDVHGCSGLLDQILGQMDDDPVVFVGDLVDRGPDSREVLEKVFDLCSSDTQKYKTLKGNHEELLLGFLNDPEGMGRS